MSGVTDGLQRPPDVAPELGRKPARPEQGFQLRDGAAGVRPKPGQRRQKLAHGAGAGGRHGIVAVGRERQRLVAITDVGQRPQHERHERRSRPRIGAQRPRRRRDQVWIGADVELLEHESECCVRHPAAFQGEQHPAAHAGDRRRAAVAIDRMLLAQQIEQPVAPLRIGGDAIDQGCELQLRHHRPYLVRNRRAVCLYRAVVLPVLKRSTLFISALSAESVSSPSWVSAERLVALMSS